MGNRVTITGPGGPWGRTEIEVRNDAPLALIAGPCQIESLDHALRSASRLAGMCDALRMPFIYKSSYDKANRTSGNTPRGPGMAEGLRILEEVKRQLGLLVTTDVHTEDEAHAASMVVDLVQIPAMLSRQTDLIAAAGKWARAVSIKRGYTMNLTAARSAVMKTGNANTILIERGVPFGDRLVNDFAVWPGMRLFAPVFFDATHSVQLPSAAPGSVSGGQRAAVPMLAAAAVAVGIAGVFLECHEDPDNAPSDGPCMLRMEEMPALLNHLKRIDAVAKG